MRCNWTTACSGCHETVEGFCNEDGDPELGSGCRECGYTGKRRHDMWLPLKELRV